MITKTYQTFSERFGYEIEKYRQWHDIKQKNFAEKLDITQGTLSNIENGKTSVTLDLFIRLLEICGSYAFYMFLLAYYNRDLREVIKEKYSAAFYALFEAWVKTFIGKEPVAYKREYYQERFRVNSKDFFDEKGKNG